MNNKLVENSTEYIEALEYIDAKYAEAKCEKIVFKPATEIRKMAGQIEFISDNFNRVSKQIKELIHDLKKISLFVRTHKY